MTRTRRSTRRLSRAAAALTAATLTAGCGADAPAEFATVRDSAGIALAENAPGADDRVPRWTVAAEPEVRIGVVEGEPAYMFDRVWAATVLPDGRIAVIDGGSRQVRLFGPDGRVVAVQGREGGGPGEYRVPTGIWALPGDSIAVFDAQLARVTILHGDSLAPARVATLRHGLMNPEHAGTLDGGRRVVIMDMEFDVSGPIGPQHADIWTVGIDDDAAAARADSVLRVVHGRHGQVPGGAEIGRPIGSPLFDPRGSVVARGDGIVYGPGDAAALHVHGRDGRLRRIIRWDAGDRALDPGEARRWIDSAVALTREARRPGRRRYLELLPVADPTPAHDRVLLDTTGRIWVSRWSPWDDQRGTEWWVFDADGRLLATAEMPARLRVFEIGEDYVLGRVEDEVGVEYVSKILLAPFRNGNSRALSDEQRAGRGPDYVGGGMLDFDIWDLVQFLLGVITGWTIRISFVRKREDRSRTETVQSNNWVGGHQSGRDINIGEKKQ